MSTNTQNSDIRQEIDKYVQGKLSADEIEELWAKLVQHPKQMDYLHTAANLKGLAQSEKKSNMHKVWMYAAAAVIVLLLAVIGTMQYAGNSSTSTALAPITNIELDYYRSTTPAEKLGERENIIRDAIELYNKDRFEEAVALLKKERSKASDLSWIAKLDITLGTLNYNEDNFSEAAYYFEDVTKYKGQVKVLTLEKAYWYLGNSYLQMNRMKEAESTMKKAYALNGAYRRVAKSFLDAFVSYRAKRGGEL